MRLPTLDFETRSAAGYVWNVEDECWEGPPGAAESGLELVGTKNYVLHPTFQVLSLSYDILDGQGVSVWTPWHQSPPTRLLRHVSLGGILSAWNIGGFELDVWNLHCVKAYGWPPLMIEQLVCDMATARAWAMPAGLANAGDVLRLDVVKDKEGKALIKKFTIPRQPTKANKAIWNEPDDPDPPPPKPKKTKLLTAEEADRALRDYHKSGYSGQPPFDDDIPF